MTSDTPSPAHATFTVERVYPQSPAKVFHAHADIGLKRRWFAEGEGFTLHHYELDLRVGGWERARFSFGDGPEVLMESVCQFVEQDSRIIFAYRMAAGEHPISASVSTVTFIPEGSGTRMTYTEQGVYFGGDSEIAGRKEGSLGLLERLAEVLAETEVAA